MTRLSERPSTSTCRPASVAASTTERIRPTLDENVVTATRPGAASITCRRPCPTACSEGDSPSRIALVESQISAITPASPRARKRASSVIGPISGAGSIFQSPVWMMVPSGVVIASDTGSGMECVTATASMSNRPTEKRSPAL